MKLNRILYVVQIVYGTVCGTDGDDGLIGTLWIDHGTKSHV